MNKNEFLLKLKQEIERRKAEYKAKAKEQEKANKTALHEKRYDDINHIAEASDNAAFYALDGIADYIWNLENDIV